MTTPYEMPDNPGSPEVTDEEATSVPGHGEPELAPEETAVLEDELLADALTDTPEDTTGPDLADDLQHQLDERTEDLRRLGAEYTNYRRRTERERQAAIDGATAKVVSQLLPILDDLELAAQHGDLDEGPFKAFADKLHSTLASLGLEGFGTTGDPFDPEIHEAVQDLSTGEHKALGTVLRRGYRLGERTIRTAMVVIDEPAGAPESTGSAE